MVLILSKLKPLFSSHVHLEHTQGRVTMPLASSSLLGVMETINLFLIKSCSGSTVAVHQPFVMFCRFYICNVTTIMTNVYGEQLNQQFDQ